MLRPTPAFAGAGIRCASPEAGAAASSLSIPVGWLMGIRGRVVDPIATAARLPVSARTSLRVAHARWRGVAQRRRMRPFGSMHLSGG